MEGKKKYCAYPFLYDKADDLRCDFEILTDEIASTVGLLRSQISDSSLRDELSKINELIYHTNPSLRTTFTVTDDEINWLTNKIESYGEEVKERFNKFVLPEGGVSACHAHILRTKCKALVRLLHRHECNGNNIDDRIYNIANLLSGYFFLLALKLNKDENIYESEFVSRNYK